MNHAAHSSNILRNAAQKKRQAQGRRNTAHVTVTSNYDRFAQHLRRDYSTKSQAGRSVANYLPHVGDVDPGWTQRVRVPDDDDDDVGNPPGFYSNPTYEDFGDNDDDDDDYYEDENGINQHRTRAQLAHDRWIRKHRIQASDIENQLHREGSDTPTKKAAAAAAAAAIYERQSASANVVLYVGLGMVSIGLIITFVGIGEKGFTASELKMVGPSLIGAGVFFCFLRVFFCTCPHCCRQRCGCQFPCCFQHGAEEPPGVGGAESRRDDVVGIAVQPLQQHGQQQSSSAATPIPGVSTQPPLPPSTENESTSRHTSSRGNPSLSSAGGGRPRTSAASTIAAAIDPPDYYADVPKLPTISSVRGSRTDVIREEDDLFVDVDETQFQQQQQHQQTDEVLLSAKALNSSGLT